jgi:hypothetical protein
MNDYSTNWTKEELMAYLLLYCANADYVENESEIAIIRSKVDPTKYEAIHKEFEKDNDYQSIQKIEAAVERLAFSETQIDDLIVEMKELFLVDGAVDAEENILFNGLKKLLKK